jgi:hypothetical protein
MKPQKPAQGILIQRDWGDTKMYHIPCECCGSDCQHEVMVEADDYGVTVTTYTTQKTKWWSMNRWQVIWELLTKGYVEYEASILMNEQQTLNYAEALKSASKDVVTFKKAKQ